MWRSGCWKRIEHLAPTLRALRSLCGGGLKVVTGCGQPGGPSAPPSPLPARSGSCPTTRKSPKGPPLSVAAGLLFSGHSCLIQEGGLTCQESLAVGVGGLKGVLWGGSSEPLQSLPQVGTGAPQGAPPPPRPHKHLNSVKQWMPSCFHHARQSAKPRRRPPSVCYQL